MGQMYCFNGADDPAMLPPPGSTPNLEDPFTLEPYHTMTGAMAIIGTTAFVLARLYTKHSIMKALKWEDWACVLGWACYVAFIAVEFRVIQEKGGQHQWNITYHDYSQQLKFSNYLDILYAPSICLIKLSILGLVLRLFCVGGRSEWFWWIIQTLNIANTIFYTAHFFIPIFVCSPRAMIWDPRGYPEGKCLDVFNLYIASAAINVGSDVAMFFVPLWRIWQLRVSRRRRAGVSAVFAVGGLAVVSSIVRLIWGFKLRKTEDFSYVKVETVLWCYSELGAGIIVSCCPIMPRLMRQLTSPSTMAGRSSLAEVESGRNGRIGEPKGSAQVADRGSSYARTSSGPQNCGSQNRDSKLRGNWMPLADAVQGGRLVPRSSEVGGNARYHPRSYALNVTKTIAWDFEEEPRGSGW